MKTPAQETVEALLVTLSSETAQQRMAALTFGAICDRYMQEEIPEGYCTAKSYRANIVNQPKPRWGEYPLKKIQPMAVVYRLYIPAASTSSSLRFSSERRMGD